MQAVSPIFPSTQYNALMKTGRPSFRKRTDFGQRVHAAREALGLSQAQVAEQLGITQPSYAPWERDPVALRPDQLAQLASILQVSIDELVSGAEQQRRTNGGPIGKARRVFEEVNKLPRHQQQRIVGVVEDMIAAQRLTAKAA
jgi:transcriptional regulator with XRE-family HTH domain